VCRHHGGNRVAGPVDELIDLARRLAKAREDIIGHNIGGARRGAADADADAGKVAAAELCAQRLETVVAGEAAADTRANLAERQVDLVVHDEHALERQSVGAARRTDRATGLVHVGLRLEQRDARTPGAGASFTQASAVAIARTSGVPAHGQPLDHREADVVARSLVLAPGITQPDDEPIYDGAAAREPQLLLGALAACGGFLSLGAVRVGGALGALTDDLSLELQLAIRLRT
jgi:hypothetical protein